MTLLEELESVKKENQEWKQKNDNLNQTIFDMKQQEQQYVLFDESQDSLDTKNQWSYNSIIIFIDQ